MPELNQTLSRRRLLAGALTAGAAGALARVPGAAAATAKQAAAASAPAPATSPPAAGAQSAISFFADPAINFQMLFVLGASGYGAAETGEALSAFDRIHSRGDTYAAVFDEFLALGRTLRAQGEHEQAAGRTQSARASFLRAAMYLDQALFFTLASAEPTRRHEGALYREMEAAWARAAALFRPRFEPVRIPYGRTHLPGWLLSPGGSTRRPTVILNNGSDAQNIDMYVYGGAAALERGWNALIFEGPGQGANLFLHNRPFIPDWERVVTPVVDWLREQPSVDRRRISIAGQSFGGYLVPRAAAYEHRLAAVVCDPGVVDPFKTWSTSLPPSLLELLHQGQRKELNAIWSEIPSELPEGERFGIAKRIEIYGQGGGYEKLKLASKFVLHARAGAPDRRADGVDLTRAGAVLSRPGADALRLASRTQEAAGVHGRRGCAVPLRADGAAAAKRTRLRLAGRQRATDSLTLADGLRRRAGGCVRSARR